MTIIEQGIQKGLISLDEEGKTITYLHQNKKRNYDSPEEKVQAETFLKLIFDYRYKPERIRQFVPVKMGVETKEADIVVYNDDDCLEPHILVECKRQEVSEQEFVQAIEQAYGYAYAMPNDVKFVWVTSGLKDEYFEVDKKKYDRIAQPDIPQFGVKRMANYRFVYDAENLVIEEGKQKYFGIKTIEQGELTRRFKQAHDALWAGGQLNPSEAFDELDKLIFCKIWDERRDRKTGEPYDFQIITVDAEDEPDKEKRRQIENENLKKRIFSLYEEGRRKDPEVFRDNIRLTNEKIRTVVGYLESVNLSETDLDSKGRAFETFMDSFFRGNFGQYFTPRPIVKFVTDVLPIKNDSLVLDTSCGSGGFLLYALDKVRHQANEMYPNHKTDVKQSQKHFRYWHDFAEKNLFGIEINEQISRAAKMNMIIHDDGHTNVITADGLLAPEKLEEMTQNRGFRFNHFDFIITNPPFGSIVRQTEKAYMKEYKLGKKEEDWLALAAKPETQRENQSTEVLFIEQAHKYLKEGGYLGIVIPDGILTNSSLQYVRNQIEEWFRIVAVVSMPQTAFAANGAGVKSSTLFLRKHKQKDSDKITSQKDGLKNKIKTDSKYLATVAQWEKERKEAIKALEKEAKLQNPDFDKKQIAEVIQLQKTEIQTAFSEKLAALKEELTEKYLDEKKTVLDDYPIFMAIAENIGYDATGKDTGINELDMIGEELRKFIEYIEK